jgi:Flp pilus assembly protein TadG
MNPSLVNSAIIAAAMVDVAMTVFPRRFGAILVRFAKDRRGLSALEFSLMLPMMVTLYLGSIEVSTGVATDRKVALVAHAVADLSSQYANITNADMSNILNAASDIMAPYTANTLQTTVSEVSINSQGQATVVWSDSLNGTALTVGQVVNVPTALAVPNTYLILGQAQYSYNPTFGYVLSGTLTLSDQIFVLPRQSSSISRTAS